MSDHGLFVVMPAAAALLALSAGLLRYIRWRRLPAAARVLSMSDRAGGAAAIWRAAIAVVLLGHVLAFAFPQTVLLWNRQPARLLLLEGAGLLGGGLALGAAVVMGLTRLRARRPRGARSTIDVVALTLVAIELVSGLVIAVRYRWGSSWSTVTLVPYLRSLLRLQPAMELVTGMPFPVRLHVICAFALLAVAPFTGMVRVLFIACDRLTHRIAALLTGLRRTAGSTAGASGAPRADNREEEN